MKRPDLERMSFLLSIGEAAQIDAQDIEELLDYVQLLEEYKRVYETESRGLP